VSDERVEILVVCTANQCRSPLGTAALLTRATDLGRAIGARSSGIQAVPGLPATPPTIDAARRMGWDLSAHRSTPLALDAIREADLVIGLERRHVQEIVLADPAAFTKTYTLKELVRRGQEVGNREPGETVATWLSRVHAGRRAQDLIGLSSADDVTDPTGSNAVDHRGTAEEIDELAGAVLDLLFRDAPV
jgi:protein-tyrosine phosphatase